MLLQNQIGSKPHVVFAKELGNMDKFVYSGCCVSLVGRMSAEAVPREI